jgi:TolB-like protein
MECAPLLLALHALVSLPGWIPAGASAAACTSARGEASVAVRAAVLPARHSALYALLPLRNHSGDAAGPAELLQRLRVELEARGAACVPEAEVERLLQARRVRYTDSLSVDDLRAVQQQLGASHVLVGTLFDFDRSAAPRVAAGLRVLDTATGLRVQSALASLRGADFRAWLGRGAITDIGALEERVVERLLEAFDERGAPHVRAAASSGIARVAVLPFGNRSTRVSAGAAMAEILSHEWFQESGVEIVELSELRSALVRAKIRTLQEADAATLASIGSALDVRYFVLGNVDRLGEEVIVHNQPFPVLDVSLRIVDAHTGQIQRTASLQLCGAEFETLLGLGAVRDAFELTRRGARRLCVDLGGDP